MPKDMLPNIPQSACVEPSALQQALNTTLQKLLSRRVKPDFNGLCR